VGGRLETAGTAPVVPAAVSASTAPGAPSTTPGWPTRWRGQPPSPAPRER
jgi:hypothetical protein